MVMDTTRLKEACASTKISISVDQHGKICGVHKYRSSLIVLGSQHGNGNYHSNESHGGTIPLKTLSQVQDVAVQMSKGVFEMLWKSESDGTSWSTSRDIVDEHGAEGILSHFFRGHFELQ